MITEVRPPPSPPPHLLTSSSSSPLTLPSRPQIFSHLNTTDLLALSMVNKQYRALLTAKSSARLWKAARDKLKLRDVVTEHFSEVHYAALVFGRNCQVRSPFALCSSPSSTDHPARLASCRSARPASTSRSSLACASESARAAATSSASPFRARLAFR